MMAWVAVDRAIKGILEAFGLQGATTTLAAPAAASVYTMMFAQNGYHQRRPAASCRDLRFQLSSTRAC